MIHGRKNFKILIYFRYTYLFPTLRSQLPARALVSEIPRRQLSRGCNKLKRDDWGRGVHSWNEFPTQIGLE